MIKSNGFIYLRNNEWYKSKNIIKMGISYNIRNRESTYKTSEPIAGEYIFVIEILSNKIDLSILDKYLKNNFKSNNIYFDSGTEFYNYEIKNDIEPYLKTLDIDYKVLTKEEIYLINLNNRLDNLNNRLNIKPYEYQQYILNNIEYFFNINNIGKLVWACGLGKALLSIFIIYILKFKSIVFGVPSKNLQIQMKSEILKIFPNKQNILFIGSHQDNDIKSTTNKIEIKNFLDKSRNQPIFIITTYHSSHLLVDNDFKFDFKIGDEAHHLVGIEKDEENKKFLSFHKIKTNKSLFMTATEKIVKIKAKELKYSMDDENIFGKCIDNKTVNWAIENKKMTDYNILILKNTNKEVDEIVNNLKLTILNKEIFMTCYMALKSFENYNDLTHMLLYTNSINDAEQAKQYIDEILSLNILSISREQIYNDLLHNKNCNYNKLKDEIDKFKKSEYGIISCIYIFGEGFDLPKLNGVCICGNMESETRIVQYLLRPNRLDKENLNKIAYIIIPYIDENGWNSEKKSYKKVRDIIAHLRNVDENIEQKIFMQSLTKDKKKKKKNNYNYNYIFEKNENELNKIKIRLKYSKALYSELSEEQDEYNFIKIINSDLKIKSKSEYINSKNKHSLFIDSPEEYFNSFGIWINWYDFLGVDTSKFIQSKEEWVKFCKEKNIKSIKEYNEKCEQYEELPKNPSDFYKSNFSNILDELKLNKRR
jgi:predicted helicase